MNTQPMLVPTSAVQDWAHLSQTTLYSDWDYFVSSAEALRQYLFLHHTIPTWNVMMCGGSPQLAIPHNWAFTWPSLFLYAFPPSISNHLLWLFLTAVGLLSLFGFLRLYIPSRLACGTAAALYAVNGYFASKYDVGIPTFATFHLMPLLFYFYARVDTHFGDRPLEVRGYWLMALLTWAFFTSALPHTLFYFYPAFLLYGMLVAIRDFKKKQARTALAVLLSSHIVGILWSIYKLWPGVTWQKDSPRQTAFEFNNPISLLSNLIHPFKNLLDNPERSNFHRWGNWEYDAYVGLVPVLLATAAGATVLFGLWTERRRLSAKTLEDPQRFLGILALLSAITGSVLALGNLYFFMPASVFRKLPIVHGIRVFGRYQILTIFGICILTALAIFFLEKRWAAPASAPLWKRARLGILVGLAVLAPVVLQSYQHIRRIRFQSYQSIRELYPLNESPVPKVAVQKVANRTELDTTHQTYLLQHGYWIQNCYEPTQIAKTWPPVGDTFFLTEPPPKSVSLSHNSIRLEYPPTTGAVTWNLPWTTYMSANTPAFAQANGSVAFDVSTKPILEITYSIRSVIQGAVVSLTALLLLLAATQTGLLQRWIRKEPS